MFSINSHPTNTSLIASSQIPGFFLPTYLTFIFRNLKMEVFTMDFGDKGRDKEEASNTGPTASSTKVTGKETSLTFTVGSSLPRATIMYPYRYQGRRIIFRGELWIRPTSIC